MKTEEYIPEDSFNRLNDAYFKYVLASPERKYLTINFIENSVECTIKRRKKQ